MAINCSFNFKDDFVLNDCEWSYINFFDLKLVSGDSVIYYFFINHYF